MKQPENRYWYGNCVVDESPEEVLFYLSEGCSWKFYGADQTGEVSPHENYVTCFNGYVCACAYGYSNVRLSQRWRIVYAVAYHRHHFIFALSLLHYLHFFIWHHFGVDITHANLPCDRLCSFAVVTCKHYSFQSHLLKILNCIDCVFFKSVRNCNQSDRFLVHCNQHDSLCLFLQFSKFLFYIRIQCVFFRVK